MAPNVFRSLLIYVARNHHTFSHVKENLITALEPLGSADALPLPCDSKGQPDYNANSPLSDLVQHVISSLKSNNHVTATPVPSPNQQPEPSLSVQPVAQSVELPNQPDSSANELPGLLRRLAAALERREQLEDNRKTGQSNNDQTNVLSSAAEDDSKQIEAVSDSVAQPANPPTSLSADSNAQPNGA
ncbi:hypothetical protein CALVIDRAFT_564008 [Calocera viscosa TUFC12733]|uniref:Uncharacterized protein n=1 Tax=Calocera viscosa (strain TUFC12733) TaxID=1330018 RepID=A0A167LWI5_CALVF|nr:hypothetical protein CALVIDRAFT_564008 [Calocera viscosa TUFC12733]